MRNNQYDDEDKKVIPDGSKVTVKLMAMDSASSLHRPGYRTAAQVRDAGGTNIQARRAAYRDYENWLTSQWRDEYANPAAFRGDPSGTGTHELRGSKVGDPCTRNGWPGRLVQGKNGELVCEIGRKDARTDSDDFPRKKIKRNARGQLEGEEEFERDAISPYCQGSGVVPDDYDGDDVDAIVRHMANPTPQRWDVPDKAREMLKAQYAAYDSELREAWRKG